MLGFKTPQIEITTLADIPAGTGLGSSGSFTTALLKALYTHRRRHLTQLELAELACHRLREKGTVARSSRLEAAPWDGHSMLATEFVILEQLAAIAA